MGAPQVAPTSRARSSSTRRSSSPSATAAKNRARSSTACSTRSPKTSAERDQRSLTARRVELRFVPPDLRRLDDTGSEVLACGTLRGRAPGRAAPRGSSIGASRARSRKADADAASSPAGGRSGDVPGAAQAAVRQGAGLRAGAREGSTRTCFARCVAHARGDGRPTRALGGGRAPGRHARAIEAERATTILLELTGDRPSTTCGRSSKRSKTKSASPRAWSSSVDVTGGSCSVNRSSGADGRDLRGSARPAHHARMSGTCISWGLRPEWAPRMVSLPT